MKLPPERMPDRALLLDPHDIRELYERRAKAGSWPLDEVWDGLLVLLPLFDNEHQRLKSHFLMALCDSEEGQVYPGVNVSDRGDWLSNFRCPDVCVFLPGNPAINHGTHYVGGPDLVVEIITPGELPHDKLDFYARVNTREVLIVNRNPWSLELHQLRNGRLEPAGTSDLSNPTVLTSSALPLTFRLIPAQPRPRIEILHPPTGKRWEA